MLPPSPGRLRTPGGLLTPLVSIPPLQSGGARDRLRAPHRGRSAGTVTAAGPHDGDGGIKLNSSPGWFLEAIPAAARLSAVYPFEALEAAILGCSSPTIARQRHRVSGTATFQAEYMRLRQQTATDRKAQCWALDMRHVGDAVSLRRGDGARHARVEAVGASQVGPEPRPRVGEERSVERREWCARAGHGRG